jgi:tRNA threonylcarbamoyl adenosine modification protein YeaZ
MSVALGEEGNVIALRTSEAGGKVAEEINILITEALEEIGRSERDITEIIVGTGPGSFTGVRTGIAAALGFASALAVPLYGVGVLRALAASFGANDAVAAYRTASASENFVAVYKGDIEVVAPCAIAVESFERNVTEKADQSVVFHQLNAGEAVARLICAMSMRLSEDVTPIYIKAVNARTLVERGIASGK